MPRTGRPTDPCWTYHVRLPGNKVQYSFCNRAFSSITNYISKTSLTDVICVRPWNPKNCCLSRATAPSRILVLIPTLAPYLGRRNATSGIQFPIFQDRPFCQGFHLRCTDFGEVQWNWN